MTPDADPPAPEGQAEPLPSALARAFHASRGRSWPGSSIPALAHPVEVACRVAAWGGSEEEILAALRHECLDPEDLAAPAASILASLPRQGGLPGPVPPALPEACRRLAACDLLSHVRSLLLDWEALARSWEARRRRLHQSTREARRAGWQGLDRELRPHCGGLPDGWRPRRDALTAAYRNWMALPLPTDPPPFEVLALTDPAHRAWADLEAWAGALEGWRLPALAREARELATALRQQLRTAEDGYLENLLADPATFTPERVGPCLRQMTLRQLIGIAGTPGLAPFMAHVPDYLRGRCRDQADLYEPRREGAREGLARVMQAAALEGSLRLPTSPGRPGAPPPDAPLTPRTLRGLQVAMDLHQGACWPMTSIPRIFHALEAFSLMLTAGAGEALALASLFDPALPGTAADPFLEADCTRRTRPWIASCRALSRFRFLAADYASLTPAWGGDPGGRRRELHAAREVLQLVLHGQRPGEITASVLLKGRFGLDREGLLDSLGPRNPQWGRTVRPREIDLNLDLLYGPEDDLLIYPAAIARLKPEQLRWLAARAGQMRLVLAGKSALFEPALEAILKAAPPDFARHVREEIAFLPELDPEQTFEARRAIAELLGGRLPEEGAWWWL